MPAIKLIRSSRSSESLPWWRVCRSRMLNPCVGYGGISCAARSAADARDEVVAQELERVVGAEIPRHHLHPHHHIGAGERLRLEAQQRELGRQRAAVMRRDERVHAGDVRVDLLSTACGRRSHADRAARPKPTVRRNRSCGVAAGAENFGEAPVADPPLELHLPQPILGVDVAEAEERVAFRGREDVRDRVRVADDLDRRRDARDRDDAVEGRQRAPRDRVDGNERHGGHRSDRDERFQHEPTHARII